MIPKNDPHISVRTNYSLAKIDTRFLQSFLRDLLREASKSQEVTEDKLIEYTDTMVSSDWHKQTNTRWNWPGSDTNIAKATMGPRVQCSHQSNFFRGNDFVSDGHVCNTFCPVLLKLVNLLFKKS